MAAIEEIRHPGTATIERGAERAARATLRDQIARLERELANVIAAAYPRLDPGPPVSSLAGPRLLSLGELERVRDALAGRLGELQSAPPRRPRARRTLPASSSGCSPTRPPTSGGGCRNADLGLPGCTTYHVRPRAGVLGSSPGGGSVQDLRGGCP